MLTRDRAGWRLFRGKQEDVEAIRAGALFCFDGVNNAVEDFPTYSQRIYI